MPGLPPAARMMRHTSWTPQANCSRPRYMTDRLVVAACTVTVAANATASTVIRSTSPSAAPSTMSLSHRLTLTAAAPATSEVPTARDVSRRPAPRAKSASTPAMRRTSVTETGRLELEHAGVAAGGGHELVVAAVLHDPAALEDADP